MGRNFYKFWVYFVLALFAFIMVMPFIWMIFSSFKPIEEFDIYPPKWFPIKWTLGNFQELFYKWNFKRYFGNSLFVSVVSTILNLFLSSMAAFGFSKYEFPGRLKFFFYLLMLTLIPWPVTIIPLYIMAVKARVVDTYFALIFTGILSIGNIFLIKQYMTSIPDSLIDAARIDGASEFYIYLRIVLPLCKPVLATVLIFTFISTWNAFIWPLLVVNRDEIRTLPLAVARFRQRYYYAQNLVVSASSIAIIPIILLFLTVAKNYVRGIHLTGVKE
ncbi:MAG: carbohydrate ABC transporter permease [Dictyoglomaceae bacterium]